MKKALLLFFCAATVMLSSCKKTVYVPDETLPNQTILINIQPNAWQASANGETLSAHLEVPELDDDTFANDDVSLMISRFSNNVYEKIPFVYDGLSYSYSITPGAIDIDIQTSDDQNRIPTRPTTVTVVKVVLITSSL